MRRWQLLCAVAAVIAGLVGIDAQATYGARVSADEPQYLLTAISLYEDFDLDISDELAEDRFRPFHEVDLNQQTLDLDGAGQRISPHDPLLPLVLAIPTGLWGWAGAKATLALFAGAVAALTYSIAVRRFGVMSRIAGVVVTAFFVGSPFASYGAQVYPAMPAALCVCAGIYAVTGRLSWRNGLVVVVAVFALPWLAVKYVPVAAVLAIGLMQRLWADGERALFGAVLVAFAIGGLTYAVVHLRIWGGLTVYASGDHFVGGEVEVVGTDPQYVARTNRLLGLLIDRYYGIAAWSPAFLLMPPGLYVLGRRYREMVSGRRFDSVIVLLTIAAGWAVATWVALTMHGWWWSGRQIVPILPLVVVAVSVLVDKFRTLLRPLMFAGAVGMLNWTWIAVEASTDRLALIVDHEETTNPLFQAWKELLPDHRIDGLVDQAMTVGWGVVFVAMVVGCGVHDRNATTGNPEPRVEELSTELTGASQRVC